MSRCRLKEWYNLVVKPDLMAKMQYTNVHQVPKVNLVTAHVTTKQASSGLDNAIPAAFMLELVTGQRAELTRVKKANAMYKVRPGFLEGAKVHMRGEIMYDFLDRLTTQVCLSASRCLPVRASPAACNRCCRGSRTSTASRPIPSMVRATMRSPSPTGATFWRCVLPRSLAPGSGGAGL